MPELPPWLLIFPVLGFLIFIHELGHFAAAKWFGIRVMEFGFGFPPRIFGISFRGTLYSVNWLLPLGGFVRFVGEEDPTDPDSFARHSIPKRAVVIVAGSFMNLLLPVLIITGLHMQPHDVLIGGEVVISAVAPGSPAQRAGLMAGDTILNVDGEPVISPQVLIDLVKAKLDGPIELNIRRAPLVGGLIAASETMEYTTVRVTPRASPPRQKVVETVTGPEAVTVSGPPAGKLALEPDGGFRYDQEGEPVSYSFTETEISLEAARSYNPNLQVGDTMRQGAIGVMIALASAKFETRADPVWVALPQSFSTIGFFLSLQWNGIVEGVSTRTNPGFAGPIGIAQATGEVVSELGISWIFQLVALLSLILGVVNLLPIPALDGGRLLFVGIEWVRRGKRVSPKKEGLVHLVGFVLIIALVLVLSYFDIARIMSGESIIPK